MLAHRIPDFVGALVTPVAYLVVMFVFDWVMGLVCLIPVLASAFCMFLMMGGGLGGKDGEGNSNAMQFMVNYQNALDKMNKAAVEYVRGIPVVKVFQQTVHSFRAFRESIVAYCDFATAYVKLCEGPQVAQLVAINATFFVLVPAGILLAGAAGDFGAFLTNFLFYVIFSALTTMMMSKIMYSSQAVTEAQDAVSRIDGILSAPLMAEVDPARAEAPADDAIDFDHVTFSYPGADAPALEDVVLHVPSGASVALVGPSGGGKTTAASLVPRFWDASAGRVLVGGVDVHPSAGRAHGARGLRVPERQAVQAEPLDNIRAARPEATREEVEAAAHAAQCDDIVAKLPQGLDTVVGARGVYLSGGECQRIALARAILKDAPIVVLDEATAFADPENEALIQRALGVLCAGKTVLMIAHRLSTVAGADAIYVLDGGRLAEQGTHAELVEAGGLYARMWADYRTSAQWRIGKEGGYAA
ncbi:MAG: ABC transporter ATP-binding protein [Eggerthella lenta]